jgi:hypothetical protein
MMNNYEELLGALWEFDSLRRQKALRKEGFLLIRSLRESKRSAGKRTGCARRRGGDLEA